MIYVADNLVGKSFGQIDGVSGSRVLVEKAIEVTTMSLQGINGRVFLLYAHAGTHWYVQRRISDKANAATLKHYTRSIPDMRRDKRIALVFARQCQPNMDIEQFVRFVLDNVPLDRKLAP